MCQNTEGVERDTAENTIYILKMNITMSSERLQLSSSSFHYHRVFGIWTLQMKLIFERWAKLIFARFSVFFVMIDEGLWIL